ncbi:cyclase family protein [Actinomadura chibensis]|uniref:Cyclase family protein n=1 Tax=Actinomadura chibensis TaxID=392828 RepID=A0A5D0NBZ5_9ACTN|nr:cyclase family protein [Actinomadura chibensis]TYB41857.1 cyclase family protein [Actinomadura chibensis]
MSTQRAVPRYDELPLSPYGGRHAWDLPRCAGVGALGLITDEIRRRALDSVRTGELVSLNAPLDVIDPPLFGRARLEHAVEVKREGLVLDDRVDALYPQVSSQWDALNHIGAEPGVFFGGTTLEQQLSGEVNGVDVWARRGIAGRGVLVDMETAMRRRHDRYGPGEPIEMSHEDVQAALEAQGTTLRPGDILVLYTGFLDWYLGLDGAARAAVSQAGPEVTAAGLAHTEDVARFLWDGGVTAVASDSLGVEAWPPDRGPEARPFGFLHSSLIGHLGMAIGELWELRELRERCRARGAFDFLLVSAPLYLRGGVGSPANAVAML